MNNRLLEQIRLKEESRSQLTSLENTGVIPNEQLRLKSADMFRHLRESIDIVDQLFTTERQVALELDRIRMKLIELHSARFNFGSFRSSRIRAKLEVFRSRSRIGISRFHGQLHGRLCMWLSPPNETT